MNTNTKIKSKMLMKTIASILITIIITQLFPAIVFGIQQDVSNSTNNIVESVKESNTIEEDNYNVNETEKVNDIEENNIIGDDKQATSSEEQNNQKVNVIEENNQESNSMEEEKRDADNTEGNKDVINLNTSPKIIGEIIEKRTLNQKHFLQKDGNMIAEIYPSNIHYEKDGQLVDINNSLEETNEDGGEYKNKDNSFQVKFSKKSNKNNLVKLQIKNHNIKWSLQNSNKVDAKKFDNNNEKEEKFKLKNISSGTVQYENILNGIDLEYNVISNAIKENIIYKDKSGIEQQIVFEFNTDNLKMEKTEDGRIIFTEKNSEEVLFFFNIPYMYDAKNETSEDIKLKLEKENGNKYILTVIPNKEWLEDETREYPVIIDPTVETSLNYENIQDTYIFNGDTGYPNRHEAHILRVGSNHTLASKNPTRSLIKFTLPNLSAGDQVISSMLSICSYMDTNEWTPPSGVIQIDVHKMTNDWTAPTASWNNLNDKYDTRISDYEKYQYDTNEPAKFYYFDITSIVKDWYITGNNYGLVLKDHTEVYNAPHSDAYFFSADINRQYINARPMVQIIYRNQTGLETYQTYHTQEVGRAGTIYTNDYNGNLILIHNDTKTPGNLLPVAISHIYNTNNKDEDWGYGKGFRLNLSQVITNETIGSNEYARYIDEDGTKHYFKKEGNNYIDEDNLGLTLNFENDTYYLKDKEHNKLKFIKKQLGTGYIWHLKELENSYNNKIIIDLIDDQYVGCRISKVTDAAGDSLIITYDSSNRLSTIKDVSGKITSYSYNSQGNLVNIKYSDNKQSTYNYNSLNLITSVYNIDNTHINYEYYNEKSNRIKSIKEYSLNNEIGNTIDISYGNNTSIFVDNKGYKNTYTFNNFGQTISISDFGNDENNIDNAYGKMYKYGENQNNKNKLTLESKLISISQLENNLLENPKFDNNLANWTGYQTENGDGIVDGAIKINGNANLDKNIYQTKQIEGNKGDIYTFGGWVKTNGVPNSDDKVKNINITIYVCRTNDTIQSIEKQINTDGNSWQFIWDEFITDSDYKWIRIHLVNNKNANETYFDNIGLFKENFGQSYIYDGNGDIVSTQDNSKSEQKFNYDTNNKLIASINPKGGKFTYEYDYSNPEKMISATNSLGNKYSFEYDGLGNIISAKGEENSGKDIKIEYEAHIANKGWLGVVSDGDITGSLDFTNQMEAIAINLISDIPNAYVQFQVHVSNIGWQDYVQNGSIAGTTGQSLQMEAIKIKLVNVPNYSVKYRTYVEGIGWQNWVKDDEISGTTGQVKKIFAIQIKLEYVNENNKYIKAQSEYSENGNYQTKIIDEIGNSTEYIYNDKEGTISKIIDSKNKEINYTYDNLDRVSLISKQVGDKTYTNSYTYENDRLKTITHNGYTYTFIYDDFGNVKQTKVENQILSTKNYENNNGNLLSEVYGNNQTISYNYDRFNRLIKETKANGNYQYTYDANSNVKSIIDSINNNTETFTYDLAERLVKSINTNGFTKEYGYDINNNINTMKYILGNTTNSIQYEYNKANILSNIKLNNNITWTNTIDKLSRLSSNKITSGSKNYTTNYTYHDVESVNNKTTTLLKIIKNGNNDDISYTYDSLGNIEAVKKGNSLTNKYYYDELNQLIREDDKTQNKTITYEYDTGGNLLNRKEYSYTTFSTLPSTANKTIEYAYDDANWKDQLINYNGKAITYDAIGNPLTYDENTYTWQNGRQLAQISNTSKNQTITYKYNDNGIRTQKTVNGTITNYYLDGTKVIYEKTGNNVIYYTYDENGRIIALKYNDIQYYYIRNGQNDIIGILDSNLNQIVSYEYDSWGKIVSIKDINGNNITDESNIGIINPYRYRSYRYDIETELYYLQSRYYNPEWGRFLNADNYGGTIGELLSHNVYAYCKNNSINMVDEDGNISITLGGTAIGVVSNLIKAVIATAVVATGVKLTATAIERVVPRAKTSVRDISIDTAIPKRKSIPTDNTIIYRYGGANPSNLTPRPKDAYTGLSFSTIPSLRAVKTTIGALNATGIVYAVKDGPTHVSVKPVGVSVQVWITAGPNSIWTQAVKSVVTK